MVQRDTKDINLPRFSLQNKEGGVDFEMTAIRKDEDYEEVVYSDSRKGICLNNGGLIDMMEPIIEIPIR